MTALVRAYDSFVAAMAALGAALLGGLALWTSYDVALRYWLSAPTTWATAVSEWALLWATFLAAPWLVARDGHVRVDLVLDAVSPRAQRILKTIAAAIACVACIIFSWATAQSTVSSYDRGVVIPGQWEVPEYLVYAVIPIGSLLVAIEFMRQAMRHARPPRPSGAGGAGIS